MKRLLFIIPIFLLFFTWSCSEDYTIIEPEKKLIVSVSNSFTLINNEVIFTARLVGNNEEDIDVTNECTFLVNSNEINGNIFSSSQTGEFTVKALLNQKESQGVVFTYHDGSEVNFKKNVLIEDFTGTWCGWCARVAHAIELIDGQTDDAIAVGIHRGSLSQIAIDYDPYNYDSSVLEDLLVNNFGFNTGYPKAGLNRTTLWNNPEPDNLEQVLTLTQGANPKLGLSMNSNLSGNTISLDVNVKFSNDFNGLKLVVYVVENGLVHYQKNYTSYYNSVNPIPDFVHNHVLRDCKTDILGDAISNSETFSGNTYSRNFSFDVPSNVENVNEIEFVAFIVNGNGATLNVRKAHLNDNQDFEEL